MIDAATLTTDARRLVLDVEDDLRAVLAGDAERLQQWRDDHTAALRGNRTSADFASWRDEHITQVAVSWVLTTVFVRFLEDNNLVEPRWFAGHGTRRSEANDAERAFFRAHPELTAREWIGEAITHLGKLPATAQLVDEHAPLHQIPVSGRMAERIIAFWRERDDDGALRRDFTDPELDTRFLGDLYQDLSEFAKSTYALLQTPEFIEEFILDQTMEPALAERPLEGFKIIDPTCGSGHFLLGAFDRLVKRWQKEAPAYNPRQVVEKALESVVGVDINPFAVAIARFRLLIAALKTAGELRLEHAPRLHARVFAGDSLLSWGAGAQTLLGNAEGAEEDFTAESAEDREALHYSLRNGQYDAVVGNPPYITVRDKARRETYRSQYSAAHGVFQLTVPYAQRFFYLAKPSEGDRPAGWIGQITSNAFMKREFGTKLIEEFLPIKDLRLIVDTSGAYVPGHGTPTMILVGKNQKPQSSTVRAVLGTRGEPGQPVDPARGLVWRSIAEQVRSVGFENEFVSVAELDRKALAKHPWSLAGGAAPSVARVIDDFASQVLGDRVRRVGYFGMMGADEAMTLVAGVPLRRSLESASMAELVIGEGVRDYSLRGTRPAWFPYDLNKEIAPLDESSNWARLLWCVRAELSNRLTFSGETYAQAGRAFYEWRQLPSDARASDLTVTFAEVSTHNHFVLDRDKLAFRQTAPVIKLPQGASEEEHLHLLGVLNSSTALFWLKQNSHNKGNGGVGGGIGDEAWEPRYQFNGTTVKDFPLVDVDFTRFGRTMDTLATQHAATQPSAVLSLDPPR